MIDWLYRSAWELSILVTLIIVVNPFVRRLLNAGVAYWLWAIPFATVILWDKPARPDTIMEVSIAPYGGVTLSGIPVSDALAIVNTAPFLLVWASGFLLYAIVRIVSFIKLRAILHRYSESYFLNSQLAANLPPHLKPNKVNYFTSTLAGTPFVTGVLKPEIYLPEDFEEAWSIEKQKWVLVHELTHVQRRDLWAQLAAEVVKACFWFNPILYFASSYFRQDQELACDYQALKNCDTNERVQYGEAMLQGMSANLLPATLAFFTLKKERFIMLQKHKKSMLKNLLGSVLCIAFAVFVLTEAPSSVAVESKSINNSTTDTVVSGDDARNLPHKPDTLSLHMQDIPLNKVVKLIADFEKKDLVNTELLIEKQAMITVTLDNVSPTHALDFILSCNNLAYENNKDTIKIINQENEKSKSQECRELLAH